MWRYTTICACFAITACGGGIRPEGPADAAKDGDDEGTDGGWGDAWTACTAPGGVAICGGSHTACAQNLLSSTCDCETLANWAHSGAPVPGDDLSVCNSTSLYRMCPDGQIMVSIPASSVDQFQQHPKSSKYECEPVEDAVLYARNGWKRSVLYADYSVYSGDPLPTPATCPSVSGVTLCGGACGGGSCPAGSVCTGRSPLHPYSFCAPDLSGDLVTADGQYGYVSCGPGYGCFAFKVQPEAQNFANAYVYCIPTALCLAAIDLPGGGLCDARQNLGNGWTDCFAP